MGNHLRGRLVIAAAAAAMAFGVQALGQIVAPGQSPTEPVKGTGLIAGQVVDASTNQPVAGVAVSIGGTPSSTMLSTGEMIVSAQGAGPGAASGAPRQVLTDGQGHYVFHDLAKGRYAIRTNGPGYVSGGYGQNRPTGPVQFVELAEDNSKLGDLTVRLWKTATITGTVLDEAGEPIVGLSVASLRRTIVNGEPRLATSSSGTTDDRGFYRISGVVPGDYLIGVMSSQTTMPAATADAYVQVIMSGGGTATSELYRDLIASNAPFPSMGGYRVGDLIFQSGYGGRGGGAPVPAPAGDNRVFIYPTTFYPSATTPAQATIVKLGSGEEKAAVDIPLKLTPTVRVSGTVSGPEGPARNTGVKLYPAGVEEFTGFNPNLESASTATDASGAFTFLGVPPGQYTLKVVRIPRPPQSMAMPSNMTSIEVSGPNGQMMMGMSMVGPGSVQPPPPPLPTDPTLWATTSIVVGELDVSDIAVALRPGVRLSGRLQFEGASNPPTSDQLQRANVSISSTEPRPFGMTPMARVEGDGRFNTGGYVPGRYQMGASIPTMPRGVSGWTFKSAMLDGRNLADDPLTIEAEDISGIVITFTDRTTQLGGSVRDARGQPDKTADVVIFPADSQAWQQGVPNTRRIRTARVSLSGTFEFTNLPAGDYYAAAVSGGTTSDVQDAKLLGSLIGGATRITVSDGDKKTQDLVAKPIR
jgi:protocatechuate 3,4-dioxygenase beta subunit